MKSAGDDYHIPFTRFLENDPLIAQFASDGTRLRNLIWWQWPGVDMKSPQTSGGVGALWT